MAESEPSNVPPFVPGLLIVGLLIIISVLIGWRSFLRRGNRRNPTTLSEWDVNWLQGGETSQLEKPKIWEIIVDQDYAKHRSRVIQSWQEVMPLSAVPVAEELPKSDGADKENPSMLSPPSSIYLPSWLPRLGYFSSSARRTFNQTVSPSAPPSHDQLQVSLVIAMPSPHSSLSQRPHITQTPPSASDIDLVEDDTRQQSSEHAPEPNDDADTLSPPEIAFGVIILPREKEEKVQSDV